MALLGHFVHFLWGWRFAGLEIHTHGWAEAEADRETGYKIKFKKIIKKEKMKWSLIFYINDNNTTAL